MERDKENTYRRLKKLNVSMCGYYDHNSNPKQWENKTKQNKTKQNKTKPLRESEILTLSIWK